jgi:hydantoinase/carbamoylase family amidase
MDEGASVHVDAAGNSVFIYKEGEPYLLLGSHVDSVRNGGRYDGIVGVLAALEVAAAVRDEVKQGLRVVIFSAEEGARFVTPCLGSSLAAGVMTAHDLATLRDQLADEGQSRDTALDAARKVGLDPIECEPWARAPAVTAFLELHIEQGSLLETERVRFGVVDVVSGAARLNVAFSGRAEHSGATPMRLRADALAAASALVLEVERIGQQWRGGTATVGRLTVSPNGVTTIPGTVETVVDIRNTDKGRQLAAVDALRRGAQAIVVARPGVECLVEPRPPRDPVTLSAWVREALSKACERRSLPYRKMPSGAGHDAAVIAVGAPAGMLFVASPNGISHVPDEGCRLSDVATGCGILCDAVTTLDRESRDARATEIPVTTLHDPT